MAKTKVGQKAQETKQKPWEEKSNEERVESVKEFSKMVIASAIKEAHSKGEEPFFRKEMSAKEIDATMPYNPSTGKPYTNETSMLLRADAQKNGYEEAMYLTMKQANFMRGKLEPLKNDNGEILFSKNGKTQYPNGIKIAYVVEKEYVPKLDADGNQIFATDKNGNLKNDRNGKPIPVMEERYLKEPRIETTTLYHISNFTDLDKSQLKPRDLSGVNKYREIMSKTDYDNRARINLDLTPSTKRDIENFMNSQNKGIDYNPIQREQKQELTKEKGNALGL
ncbi:ArdC-like ssDNA-binding domain-containing protein [Campylobacter lanienae]|uniref:ArdC-like ssDNA-binding domain-containing protein n=1 Tax=Campylobacter lanienae TaxID=75658 RepID=UPI000BB4197D|nr:ArdC-like ssDNA-binding domain-containing protein [Campylobacter lanienae]